MVKNKYPTLNGKITCTYYECTSVEKGKDRINHGSIMNHPMSLSEIKKYFGLVKDKDDLEWFVVVGVDMIQKENDEFEYKSFEIIRGGNVPEDFSYDTYKKKS